MLQPFLKRSRPWVGRGIVLSTSRSGVEVERIQRERSQIEIQRKSYATSPAAGPTVSSTPIHSTPPAAVAARQSGMPSLGSIEASWVSLPREEQESIYSDLQELQKKDWKELSLDQKKAGNNIAYYIAYGPHGPRAPIVPPNTNGKVFAGVVASIVVAFGVFSLVRLNDFHLLITRFRLPAQAAPKTLTKEWKEAQQEYAKEQKMDPFTGATRADGKGKSHASASGLA
ncbi:MAG: Cytochrome c oxidase subunit 5A [Cyphobasidiales sp. Tagirdzhanova-0007]|nr:MAG: Cytochrome c oxidase subunit 5A [Cyphobasidiales sp. Tagirdzhanova-0007]